MAELDRRDLLVGGIGLVAGALATEGANALLQRESEQKLVGGNWVGKLQEGQEVNGTILLEFKVNAAAGVEVHHATFTSPSKTAPNVKIEPEDYEQGFDRILGHILPDANGICRLSVNLSDIGAPFGPITFNVNVFGRMITTGHITTQTINYDPNGPRQFLYSNNP